MRSAAWGSIFTLVSKVARVTKQAHWRVLTVILNIWKIKMSKFDQHPALFCAKPAWSKCMMEERRPAVTRCFSKIRGAYWFSNTCYGKRFCQTDPINLIGRRSTLHREWIKGMIAKGAQSLSIADVESSRFLAGLSSVKLVSEGSKWNHNCWFSSTFVMEYDPLVITCQCFPYIDQFFPYSCNFKNCH